MRAIASALLISVIFSPLAAFPAHAARFSDVPSTHRFAVQIEALAELGVIMGNPNGTFDPNGKVNRAAMLVMLYRARNWAPAAPAKTCARDVPAGIWFEAVVCDALAKKFVQGYGDGFFKPDQAVTRAEALKMTHMVLGISVPPLDAAGIARISSYKDVLPTAWYASFVAAAMAKGMTPLPGDSATAFGPDVTLTRGEAAAYIYGGLNPKLVASSSSSSAAASVVTRSQASVAGQLPASLTKDVDFPFSDDGQFKGKSAAVYRFALKERKTVRFDASASAGKLSCRLFKLESDGTSQEYYLGDEAGMKCALRVTLVPGSYQLDLKPAQADATFSLTSKEEQGDGNDGFVDAKKLLPGKTKADALATGDLADWFTFSLSAKTNRTVRLAPAEGLRCIVYAMRDVDMFGFDSPECNVPFEYAPGTYFIGVLRDGVEGQQDYSVWLE
jgi:hypothetical protein